MNDNGRAAQLRDVWRVNPRNVYPHKKELQSAYGEVLQVGGDFDGHCPRRKRDSR